MGGEADVVAERDRTSRRGERGGGERDELDVMHERRGRRRAEQLEAVRGMVAGTLPHVAEQLGDDQLAEIWGNMNAQAVNAEVGERLQRLHERYRKQWGDAYYTRTDRGEGGLSSFMDERDRIESRYVAGAEDFYLPVHMDLLLDGAILDLQEDNVVAEMQFRTGLWDALRSQPAYLRVQLKGETPTFSLHWRSDEYRDLRPLVTDGGRVTWDKLMEDSLFSVAYYEQVENGPAFQYLMKYYERLAGEILDWEEKADFIKSKVEDHPIVSRISFWIQWDQRPTTPSSSEFKVAREAVDLAYEALLDRKIEIASLLLAQAEEAYIPPAQRVADYDASSIRGAARAVTVLTITKEVGKFAGGVLTGRGPLAAAQFGRAALAVGAGTGAVSMAYDLAGQASADVAGLQDGIDFGGALMRSGKDAVVASVATWTGMHATRWAHQALRPTMMKYPGIPDFARRHIPEVLGGAIASPAATGTDVALSALTGQGRVPDSVGDLGKMMIEDITIGALTQVGLSPMIGRIDGKNVKLKPTREKYVRGGKGVMTVYHGTATSKMAGVDAGIDPRAGAGYPGHDFGAAFYGTPDRAGGDTYAYRKGNPADPGAVAEVHVRMSDFGRIVDVRPRGAHREAWEWFLREPYMPNLPRIDGLPYTRLEFLARGGTELRSEMFETFLRKEGLADADTIFGSLGEPPTTSGISEGADTQIAVRSQAVADHLSKLGFLWSAPKPR